MTRPFTLPAGIRFACAALLLAAALAAGACTSTEEQQAGDAVADQGPRPPDAGAAFDTLLAQVRVEAWLYGGWFGRVVVESDTVDVVASWNGADACIIGVAWSTPDPYAGWSCQPQKNPDPPQHCRFLTRKCTFSDDRRRCECAFELPEAPQMLHFFPSTQYVNTGGWEVSGAHRQIELPSVESADVAYVDFEIPERYLLCQGDALHLEWVTATGLDLLLAKQYESHVLAYESRSIGYKEAEHYDYLQDVCFDTLLDNPGSGLFAFDLAGDLLADCDPELDVNFRPVAYRTAPLEEWLAQGSVARVGKAAPPILMDLRDDCGGSLFPLCEGFSAADVVAPEHEGGGLLEIGDGTYEYRLGVAGIPGGGFFLTFTNKEDYRYWSRYDEAKGAFSPVRWVPEAFAGLPDATWVGVRPNHPAVFRAGPDGLFEQTDEEYSTATNPQGTTGNASLLAVADSGNGVAALFVHFADKKLFVVSPHGTLELPSYSVCLGGGGTAIPKGTALLLPGDSPGTVVIRQACMGSAAFGLADTVVELESGNAEMAYLWNNEPTPDCLSGTSFKWPRYFDRDLALFTGWKYPGQLEFAAYRTLADGAPLLAQGSQPSAGDTNYQGTHTGDALHVAWNSAASGPYGAGDPVAPLFLTIDALTGTVDGPCSGPHAGTTFVDALAATDAGGGRHLFGITGDYKLIWFH
jgi:hypothetical protein